MKKVLMIALELPPCRSAGVQRTLRFMENLPSFKWQPIAITATENVYKTHDYNQKIPCYLEQNIIRAKSVDASIKYSIRGKYFQWITIPDRYWPWYFDAVKQAVKSIEDNKPDIIWSTYPVLTAHLVANKVYKKYGIPWVADFRDPLQCHYDPLANAYAGVKKWLEKSIVSGASMVVLTSMRSVELYRELYPCEPPTKFVCIENGFQYESAIKTEPVSESLTQNSGRKFTLLYSGVLYSNGRDPSPLFFALSDLKRKGVLHAGNFILNFRASKNRYTSLIKELNIEDVVAFLPAVSFEDALVEMQNADANVLIQDAIFNRQIPGKIFDYISVRKPILAICPEESATRDVVNKLGYAFGAKTEHEISSILKCMLSEEIKCDEDIERFSRKNKTKELASIFDRLYEKSNV